MAAMRRGVCGLSVLLAFARSSAPDDVDGSGHAGLRRRLDRQLSPSCAGGRFRPYFTTLHAFRPRHGHFTRLTLRVHHGKRLLVTRLVIVRSVYEFANPG